MTSRQDKPGKGGSDSGNLSLESRGFDSLPAKASHQPEASLAWGTVSVSEVWLTSLGYARDEVIGRMGLTS
ncbi:hypothetical protein OKW35_000339 [Paraburkholderia sp. MM5477-R1]